MDAILGFFRGIADVLVGAVDFLIGIIRDLVYLAQITARAVSAIPGFFAWLPPPAVALLLTIFSVVVIYKLLGREG